MNRITKIVTAMLVLALLCCSVFAFAACEDKNKKYEVTFKIICRDPSVGTHLGEWIMTPDKDELVLELEYRENGYLFELSGYKPYGPDYNDEWIYSWKEGFVYQSYIEEGNRYVSSHDFTQRGKYMYLIFTDDYHGNPYYYRMAIIYITIV